MYRWEFAAMLSILLSVLSCGERAIRDLLFCTAMSLRNDSLDARQRDVSRIRASEASKCREQTEQTDRGRHSFRPPYMQREG